MPIVNPTRRENASYPVSISWLVLFTLLLVPLRALPAEAPLRSLHAGGMERLYLLSDHASVHPAPLVIVLHGGGGNGRNAMEQTGFEAVARSEGLLVAYPYGTARRFSERLLTWNAGHCCAHAMRETVDDVGFIAALIDELVAQGLADPRRVYVTGLSNGGMMAHRLAANLPDRITAVAPVIASLFGDEPQLPLDMPVLIINGAADEIVKPAGGELRAGGLLGRDAADRPSLPIANQAVYWAERNACTQVNDVRARDYTLREYSQCRTNAVVQHYVVNGNGHAWPGGSAARRGADQPLPSFDASRVIWDFFNRYPTAGPADTGAGELP